MKNGTEARFVGPLPMCDVCGKRKCVYDAKTRLGPWAFLCEECYKVYGIGLGVGRGQRLISTEEEDDGHSRED